MSTVDIWNGYMRSYDFLTKVDSYDANIRQIAAAAAVGEGSHVLDAGSGTGNLSMLLRGNGVDVVSCDFSQTALDIHRKKDPAAKQFLHNLEEPLPLEPDQFDAVCCASVLFALSQSGCQFALCEFRRVLKPGGRLIVTVPSAQASLIKLIEFYLKSVMRRSNVLTGVWRALIGLPALCRVLRYTHKLKSLPDWKGFHRFDEEELRQLAHRAGFTDIRIGNTYGNVFLMLTARR